jgi:predicted aminopeptidase
MRYRSFAPFTLFTPFTRFARFARFAPRAAACCALLTALAGCDGLAYVGQLAQGQFGIQSDLQPIPDVLASGQLTADQQAKLELIVAARDYARQSMGLTVGDSYTMFYDTHGAPLAWNLTAARRDALVPHTWTFPVLGTVPYLAFFDENYLHAYDAELQAEGWDTYTYQLDAYSTLGVFADPVRSPMLNRHELSLAETIIHELLHNTIYRGGDTTFNESLATFIGRQGAEDFLLVHFGDASGWPALARNYYADVDTTSAFLLQLYNDLAAYYAQTTTPDGQPLTSDAKIAGREAVYQAARERFVSEVEPTLNYPATFAGYANLPTNNAWMLGNYRYNYDLSSFEAVYTANGGDWATTLEVFRAAADSSGDPFQYLRDWVTSR